MSDRDRENIQNTANGLIDLIDETSSPKDKDSLAHAILLFSIFLSDINRLADAAEAIAATAANPRSFSRD